jgi:6-phosphogluconate dehydrogenase
MNNLIKVVMVFGLVIVISNPAIAQGDALRRVKSEFPGEPIKELGFVGLGRMGQGMAKRLQEKGFKVMGYDLDPATRANSGLETAVSLRELVSKMPGRKVVWLMVPIGKPVDDAIAEIRDLLKPGDIIIDGGNSHYKDSLRRAEELKKLGVSFLDVGTSGGSRAAEGRGMSFMVGGDQKAYKLLEPLLKALTWTDDKGVPAGYGRVGESGAGHFVKAAVHNSIEYGFFQGLAEALEILGKYFAWDTDRLRQIMEKARDESAIRSWTASLAEETFRNREAFEKTGPQIGGGTFGSWGQEAGDEWGVDTPVLDVALKARKDSRNLTPYERGAFSARVIAGMRFYMGGHDYQKLEQPIAPEALIEVLGTAEGKVKDQPEEFVAKVISAVSLVWLQALKEGYELMVKSPFAFDAPALAEVNRIWENGSVIRSYLVELGAKYFSQGKSLAQALESIQQDLKTDLSTVRYIQQMAKELGIPTPALDAVLK